MSQILDHELTIYTTLNRNRKRYQKEIITIRALSERLSRPDVTKETFAEYLAMPLEEKNAIKDVGGFTAGILKDGIRKKHTVLIRTAITTDVDYGKPGMDPVAYTKERLPELAWIIYTTHSHSPEAPRWRVVLPTDRQMTPEEHWQVTFWVAKQIDPELIDPTSHEINRMMFWPSVSTDGEFKHYFNPGELLNVDAVLTEVSTWTEWPEAAKVHKDRQNEAIQADPLAKDGLIGAFCRTYYPIGLAINKFLDDKYKACQGEERYTWAEGSAACGVIVYEDKFTFSHHATDPAHGRLVNAFDLVRIHYFAELDELTPGDTPTEDLPSFQEMLKLAANDPEVKATLKAELETYIEELAKKPELEKPDYFRDILIPMIVNLGPLEQGMVIKRIAKILGINKKYVEAELKNSLIESDEVKNFFSRDGSFIPERLANKLMCEHYFKAAGGSIYYYAGGVYRLVDAEFIKNLCRQILGEAYLDSRGREIVSQIKTALAKSPDEIDIGSDNRYINVKNGLIDCSGRRIKLLPHTPEIFSTIQLPVVYDPSAKCPRIEQFFREVLVPDCIRLVEEAIGDTLRPGLKYQITMMLLGFGANGKSVFLALLTAFLGAFNVSNESLQALSENRFRAANLYGKLANIFADIPGKPIEDNSVFKALTGGSDTITAERKHEQPFSFINQAKLIFSANKLPRTRDNSTGFYRRWIILRFPNQFKGAKRDSKLLEKLTTPEELSGLLNLALAGLKRLEKRGHYDIPQSVKDEIENYQLENDSARQFFNEKCEPQPKNIILRRELYAAYEFYCHENGYKPVGQTEFNQRLRDVFPDIKERNDKGRAWSGIRFTSQFYTNDDEFDFLN